MLLVAFMSIVALEKLFEFGGEQLAMYCGPDLGDLITITLNKCVFVHLTTTPMLTDYLILSAVEATLAIILLVRCEYVFMTCLVPTRHKPLLTHVG
jgi:Ca2+:H+ antiporter